MTTLRLIRTSLRPATLKTWRRRMGGWSQERLAHELGVYPLTVSKWERGVQWPAGRMLELSLAWLEYRYLGPPGPER